MELIADAVSSVLVAVIFLAGIYCGLIAPIFIFRYLKSQKSFTLPIFLYFLSPLLLMAYAEGRLIPHGRKLLKSYVVSFTILVVSVIVFLLVIVP